MSTPKEVTELAKKIGDRKLDIKFVDTFGTRQKVPIRELSEAIFADGAGCLNNEQALGRVARSPKRQPGKP